MDADFEMAEVFPAYAGVFPARAGQSSKVESLPRIRGGVSEKEVRRWLMAQSSPHTRGCFLRNALKVCMSEVFPAYAGVFLLRPGDVIKSSSLPRIRGGVSVYYYRGRKVMKSSPHTRGCFS